QTSTIGSLKCKVLSEWDIVTSSDIILAQTLTKTNSFILNQIEKLKQRAIIQHSRLQTDFATKTFIKRKAMMTATNSWLLAEAIYQYIMSNDDNNNNRSEQEPIRDIWPFLDSDGRVRCQRNFRISIYRHGMDTTIRRIGWKHLLNVYPDDYTGQERIDFIRIRSETYQQMRNLWQQNRMTDPEGMSDLASPLLYVMKDESHAYIAFCALMQRLGENFSTDGCAISRKFRILKHLLQHYDREFYRYLQGENAEELLFCYRWILITTAKIKNDKIYAQHVK
ncbi:TBC1 domain containing protein, partial [Euroglyphus maynei]